MPATTPAYALIDDLKLEFGEAELLQLARSSEDKTVLDEDKVNAMLVNADATIDGFLTTRFLTPLTPVPVLIKQIACDIARYRLRNRSGGQSSLSDVVRQRYDDAIKNLEKIRDSKINIEAALRVSAAKSIGQVSSSFPKSQMLSALEGY